MATSHVCARSKSVRTVVFSAAASVFALVAASPAQQPFTLQQALSAPYSSSLIAAPAGALFAWVEDAEGRHNLWVGGPKTPARQLTHNTEDDAQDLTGLTWSPDAKLIAYTYGAENGAAGAPANPAHLQRPTALRIIVQPVAGDAAPTILLNARGPFFLNAHTLLFLREGKIWTHDLAANGGDGDHQLVYDRGSASALTLSPDGKLLAYVSSRREPGHPGHSFIALYDLGAKTLRFVAPSTDVDFAPSFSPDGKQLAWLRRPFTETLEFDANRVSATPWSIQLCDLTTNATRTLYQPAPNKYGSVLPRMATGSPFVIFAAANRLLFFSDADNWVHLYALDPTSTGTPTLLTPGPFEVEDASLSPDRKAVVYASSQWGNDKSDADRRHLWKLDLTAATPQPIALTRGEGIETKPIVAPDGSLAALVGGIHSPMHVALIAADGSRQHLNDDTPSTFAGEQFVTPKQVLFTAVDGIRLHGQLFEPASNKPGKHAALIFVHGGPKRQMLLGFPAMGYYSNAYAMNQYLVSQGFIVLSVNYRCGIGYGLEFRQCLHAGADGGTEYNDALAAVKYLRAQPDVDPARIGIWGGSYGGYLTALALARNSDLFAAGVDFHGVHDWILEDNHDDWLEGSNATKDAIAVKAHAASPLADISRWHSPVLLIHGDDDPEVAYGQTPALADQLRARKLPFEELVFPDEVHGFLLHKDWLAAYEAEAAFFKKVLKPENIKTGVSK